MEIEATETAAGSESRMAFDELPVGRKSNQNQFADEHPPGYVEAPAVQEEQPLEKRLASKMWKFRLSALDELLEQCQKGGDISRFEAEIAGWLADSNVNCQEKAFRLLDLYLSKQKGLSVTCRDLLKVIIEKGFPSSKSDIVKHANSCVVELLDKGYKADIYSALADGLLHKNPKVQAACVDAYINLLINFGPKRLDMLKVILKELQAHCETTSPTLRNALLNFYKEAYKWLGEGLLSLVKLKKPLVDDFEKFTKSYQRIPMVPLRATEQEAAAIETGKVMEVDAYSMADPVDVLLRFDEAWVDRINEISKWSEKKDALDAAIAELSTPKIVQRDHYHIIGLAKKLLADSNLAIQICGIKLTKALASGLRKEFRQGAKVLASLLLVKLRDKKTQVVDETHKCLKALLHAISLEDMLESIKEGLVDKAPQMRQQTLKFVQDSMTKKDGKIIRQLFDCFLKLTTDGAAEVRDKVIEVIRDVKNLYGSGFIGDKFQNVQSQKLQHILAERCDIPVENIECQPADRSMSIETKPVVQKKVVKTSSLQPKETSTRPAKSVESMNHDDSLSHSRIALDNNRTNQLQEPNISSPNEAQKLQAYQSLISKPIPNVTAFLKSKAVRESQTNVLRAILTIYERAGQDLTRADLEYLMLHDWRKAKSFLSDYLMVARIGQDCGETIRQYPLLKEILGARDSGRPKAPLVVQMHSYMPKMMHAQLDLRLAAANALLSLLQQYKPIGEDFTPFTKEITELSNVIKCRINDREPEVSKKYITVVRLLTKIGVVNKIRGRQLLPAIVARLGDLSLYLDVREYMNENLVQAPGNLFNYLHTMLANEHIRMHLLVFLEENISQFIKTADMKAYLPALFHLLGVAGDTAAKAEHILDYIVQSQGQAFLDKSVRELRIDAPESYLSKWGLEKRSSSQFVELSKPALPRYASKSERLREEPFNPWPLIASPSHIHQLVAMMSQLPSPFCEMGTLLPVSPQLVQKLSESPILPEYSDIVVKWLFWRFQIERHEVVLDLIGLAKRLVMSTELEEMELIILLAGLLGVVKLGNDVLKAIDSLHRLFKPVQQHKLLRFWVNSIKDSPDCVNEILQVLMLSFRGGFSSELLVELATHQSVRSNAAFLKCLLENYDRKSLQVYGFDLGESAIKPRLSHSRRNENYPTNNGVEMMLESFRTKESGDIIAEIGRLAYPKSQEEKAEFYVELWEVIYHPIIQEEIKPQSVIAFSTHVIKELNNHLPLERVLKRLARVLLDLLMELDERKPKGHTDIIRSVNTCMLRLIDVAPNQPMIEVMLEMVREELSKTTEYNKIVGMMCKCLNKLLKNPQFSRVEWYVDEVLKLFEDYYSSYLGVETPQINVLKQTVNEAIGNGRDPKYREYLRQMLLRHSGNEFIQRVFRNMANANLNEKEDSLMTRLNVIKARCGVDDIRLGPNIWEKKSFE